MQRIVRNMVLGRDYFVESYSDFKTILLSTWYALFCIAACLVYLLIDILGRNTYATSLVFLAAIVVCVITIFLHRFRHHLLANVILFPTITFIVYLFASSESAANGTPMFYLVTYLGAFTIFGLNRKTGAFLFLGYVLSLFWLSYFSGYSVLPYRQYGASEVLLNLAINFGVAMAAISLVVGLLIRLHRYNEQQVAKQNDLLRKTNSELDRFVYSTSHDLRAPLNSVMGLITLAERSHEAEIKNYLDLMRKRIHSMENFIQDVTDFSRNNRLSIDKKEVAVASLVMDVWDGLRFIDGTDAIRFKMDIKCELTVFTDPSRLRIVLGNLLSNAIRYHNLQKVDPFIRVSAFTQNKNLWLEVEDNGQGIDSEYLKKIFGMFFRANANSKGSGLGLYIVSEVLEKVEGSIDVESTLGKGTCFKVRIPL
jgi:signal transduction histidine kinase